MLRCSLLRVGLSILVLVALTAPVFAGGFAVVTLDEGRKIAEAFRGWKPIRRSSRANRGWRHRWPGAWRSRGRCSKTTFVSAHAPQP